MINPFRLNSMILLSIKRSIIVISNNFISLKIYSVRRKERKFEGNEGVIKVLFS